MTAWKSLSLACLLSLYVSSHACGEPLVLVGQQTVATAFVGSLDDEKLIFQIDGQDRPVGIEELISWSTRRINYEKQVVLLNDGSQIVLAESWTGKPNWQLTENKVVASSALFGQVELPRSLVRAILIRAPKGIRARTRFVDQQIGNQISLEGLRLVNGDQWDGERVSVSNADEQQGQQIEIQRSGQRIAIPNKQVAAIVLNPSQSTPQQPPWLTVGTRDGSLLKVMRLRADSNQLRMKLAGGAELAGGDSSDVTYLRSHRAPVTFLSDQQPASYRHVPYLQVPWKYRRDRNVLGTLLQAGGRIYDKGLGLHTASRLTYDLTTLEGREPPQRFIASVAVDDAAGKRGSVVFRVYLRRANQWQQAYTSPVVRGGDEPLAVSVELLDATQLALVTDFADRGDELDYANWLEARLE